MTGVTDSLGNTFQYAYDSEGNLLEAIDAYGKKTAQMTYDAVGNLSTLTYPGNKQVKYTYDAANRLTGVTDWAGRKTQYEYDNNGRLTKTIRPNQTVLTQTYNAAGQLLEQKDLDKDGKVISSYTFEYDAVGNIVSESSPYLAPGVSLTDIPNIDMTYTEDNRLATFNGQTVQFDADGNMITGPLNGQMGSFVYDSRNRLVTAGNLTYEYDAENNRVSVTENIEGSPIKTEYVVNPHAALSQVLIKTVGNEKTYYVYGLGLIGQEVAEEYSTYHFDLRGSTVAITDVSGKVTDRYQYSAYGELLGSTGDTDTPFLFNGRDGVVTDANGLYYMRARYYNPEIRRFVSQDTLLGVVIDGQSLNRYAYVQGNPVGFVDPLGLARDGWGKTVASAGVGFIPVAGDIKDVQETLTGKDLITGEKLSTGDRVITGVCIMLPVVNGKVVREGVEVVGAGVRLVKKKIGGLFRKKSNPVNVLGKGSTGRTVANNLYEQLAMKEVMSNPLENAIKVPLKKGMADSRWLGTDGWTKMQRVITTSDGKNITIHFNYNEITGVFDDFKFKN
ncbi:MAG: pre-toxin TG domain-containing protein [Clostridia bacterium]|nr:pre-toxin TG domain-containing protein [Clostridia bacterium]